MIKSLAIDLDIPPNQFSLPFETLPGDAFSSEFPQDVRISPSLLLDVTAVACVRARARKTSLMTYLYTTPLRVKCVLGRVSCSVWYSRV
jgi:hypothetical protein